MTDQQIWDNLMEAFNNPYGVAAIMGNLFAESSMNPACCTGLNGQTASDYISKVKHGEISKEQFSKDGVAFGLAQWRYHTRKEALYNYASEHKGAIDDPEIQLGYLKKELITGYSTARNAVMNAKSVKEASDTFMLKYEKPGNTGAAAKDKRTALGERYYVRFAAGKTSTTNKKKMVATTTDRVFLRAGDGKQYPAVSMVQKAGTELEYVAVNEDKTWYAVRTSLVPKSVVWISAEFSKEEV